MEKEFLDIMVEDALMRIKRDYDRCDGKIVLSFSGGKDSTIIAKLIEMSKLPIELVFSNTGVELEATLDFVKKFDCTWIKPEMTMSQTLKKYGKPVLSKEKSDRLAIYHRNIDNNPEQYSAVDKLINGTFGKIANKHIHLLHEDLEFKTSAHCCDILKKKPFQKYMIENDLEGYFTGVRTAEGGNRLRYTSCVQTKKLGNKVVVLSMPIIDWTDEVCDAFVEEYNIELSEAYTTYGMKRTGCVGCPFNQELAKDMETLYNHEPKKYKGALFWFKDSYIQQKVRLDFDEEYTKELEEMLPIIEERRIEMLEKYRSDSRELNKKKRLD